MYIFKARAIQISHSQLYTLKINNLSTHCAINFLLLSMGNVTVMLIKCTALVWALLTVLCYRLSVCQYHEHAAYIHTSIGEATFVLILNNANTNSYSTYLELNIYKPMREL